MDEPIEDNSSTDVRLSKLLRSHVNVHEVNQLEIIISYALRAKSSPQDWIQPERYEVDAFFVYPQQTRISKDNYPIVRFYNDIRSFIRFREPKLSFKEILGMGRRGQRSPLVLIENYIRQVTRGDTAESPDAVIEESRIFGCSYFSYFQRRMERFERSFLSNLAQQTGKDPEHHSLDLRLLLSEAEENLDKSYFVLRTWRTIVGLVEEMPKGFLSPLRDEINNVNEYCSYIFRAGLLRLSYFLDSLGPAVDRDGLEGIRSKLKTYMRLERWYSYKAGFFWITEESAQESREQFLFRRGVLKRRIWSSLYLNTRKKPLFAVQRQIGAMIGSALAGAWGFLATVFIGFFAFSAPQRENLWSYGTFLFLTLASFSYVLKDRIKEFGRGYFEGGLLGNIPDTSNRVIYHHHLEKEEGVNVGTIQEKSRYVSLSKLPKEVYNLVVHFNKDNSDILDLKSIIHYQKVFHLAKVTSVTALRKIRAVHDIIRLFVDSYLAPLDARVQEVLVFANDGSVKKIPAHKVYYMDVVLRKTVHLEESRDSKVTFEYYRVVLSKQGIERINPLM